MGRIGEAVAYLREDNVMRALSSWNRERCPESSQRQPEREEPASELLPDYNGITKAGGRGSKERRDEDRSIRQKSTEVKAEERSFELDKIILDIRLAWTL